MAQVNRPYAQYYQEKNFELVSRRDIPGTRSFVLTRLLRCELPEDLAHRVLDEMNLYVSAKNASPQRWVDNPSVGKAGEQDQKFCADGRYRLILNAYNPPDKPPLGIYQELAYGYLQPPAWTDEATDADTQTAQWAPLDAQARVLEYQENRTNDAKAIMGIANYYVVIYPNVATETVTSFEAGLTHRPDLDLTDPSSQPRFFAGTLPPGNYRFCHSDNKPSEDGASSDVIAILCNTKAVVNVPIMMVRNWQQYDWKTYWSGVPQIPSDILPLDILALDVPTGTITYPPNPNASENTQQTKSGVYKMTNFQFDREKGLYHIEITYSQAQPWHYTWIVPTGNTATTEYYVEFYHQTPTWVQACLDVFKAKGLAVTMRPYLDEFKTVSGRIWGRTPGSSSHSNFAYLVFPRMRSEIKRREIDHETWYMWTYTIFEESKGNSVAGFLANLHDGGPGGLFQELGNDWYHCQQVMWVYEKAAKATALLNDTSPNTLAWTNGWVMTYQNADVGHRTNPGPP